ncbi:MAG: ABC transporter ATP-binding protein [Gemmatimonadota bacterium]
MIFRLADATYRYPDGVRNALDGVSVTFPAGRHSIVVGPNGAGKTTLARVLLGRLRVSAGAATIEDLPSVAWRRRDLARRVGTVLQETVADLPLTVRGLVAMGRYPYLPLLGRPGPRDRAIVAAALERTDLGGLADRAIDSLSGGERQRAKLARALAQTPEALLLDEPTAHLDLGHEMAFFEMVAELAQQQSLTIISITHNLNIAARFADWLVLLAGGRVTAQGRPSDVLVPERLESAFQWPVEVRDLGELGLQVVPRRRGTRG